MQDQIHQLFFFEHSPPFVHFICKPKQLLMNKIFLFFICTSCFSRSEAQLTKGYWLVGGNGTISRQQEKLIGSEVKSTRVQLAPNLGYFIVDKFAIGILPSFEFFDLRTSTSHSSITSWAGGPFVRYYFLRAENRTNILAETAYQYSSSSNGYSQDLFLFSGGPVIFFNNSVALEVTANYRAFKVNNEETSSKTFFITIGLQVHLLRDRD